MDWARDPVAEEARRAWDRNAAFWDERIAEGNDFHLTLVRPAVERLLGAVAGERVLDVCCGNGVFARRLAACGARVVACDFSAPMLERALARGDAGGAIDYRQVDATDEAQLAALGAGSFAAAVCNMALMDMAAVAPLARALAGLLQRAGRFVFAVSHPCFNRTGSSMVLEREDRDGRIVVTRGVKVTRYLNGQPARGLGIVGQPVPQPYFDRPLHALLAPFLAAGFVLDGLEEPAFPAGEAPPGEGVNWGNLAEIPPVLAVRLRAGGSRPGAATPGP